MSYINPSPGVANSEVVVTLRVHGEAGNSTVISVPALQTLTVNNSNDLFTWSQLDGSAKFQIPTTSTNSVAMTVVVDPDTFFGTGGTAPVTGTTAERGILGLSKGKALVDFDVRFNTTLHANGAIATSQFVSGEGYLASIAPTISADQPVWTSPLTIAVTGEYTIDDAPSI